MPPILIATRGSDLALAQANAVLKVCHRKYAKLSFELVLIKTTGDKLQAAPDDAGPAPRALFTKELEEALLAGRADVAVHSLKDLPTDLPAGLRLAAVAGARADARDVLIYRTDNGLVPRMRLSEFPPGLTVATGSARRVAQLLALRPDFQTLPIRGNVPTRLRKLVAEPKTDALILAAAGLRRLGIRVIPAGVLRKTGLPDELAAYFFEPKMMLPCVGQGAIGLEIRDNDKRMMEICRELNHYDTFQCVAAERAFLRAMGGGCQTPIAAYACVIGNQIHLRAVTFLTEKVRRAEGMAILCDAVPLGEKVAAQLLQEGS